ncbi:MAG: hypothetical protein GY759_24195 [Chloroflexi bacterium]|nr:hypothetical protein [Chloroflexota bacterium]
MTVDIRRQRIRVEAYAGASYPERPLAVWWHNQRLVVKQVVRSWRTPEELHFLVEIETLGRAQLTYFHQTDSWTLT